MTDPLQVDHPGAFGSFLRWLGRPKNAAVDFLSGNLEGAGRQLGDFAGDAVDSILPGDWIPELSRTQDYGEASDLVGGMAPGLGKTAVDVLGGIALDPISYIPGGMLLKGASGGAKLAKAALPASALEALDTAGHITRSTFGAQRVSPDIAKAASKATDAGSLVREAQSIGAANLLKGLSVQDRAALGEIMHNLRRDASGRPVSLIDDSESLPLAQRAESYLSNAPEGVNRLRVTQAVSDLQAFNKRQLVEGQQPSGIGGNVFRDGPGITDYYPRQFSGVKEADILRDGIGRPSAIKERKLERASDVLAFLRENPMASLEFDPAKVLGARAEQSGSLAARGSVGQSVLDLLKAGKLSVPPTALESILEMMPKPRPVLIPPSGTYAAADPLGAASTGFSDLYNIGKQTGKSLPPQGATPVDIEALLNRVAGPSDDVYGIGRQSGTAKPPGSLPVENIPSDLYGIGRQSGTAKPPGSPAILEPAPESLGSYGLGSQSGVTKPPTASNSLGSMLGANPEESLSLLGKQSGKARPPSGVKQGVDLSSGTPSVSGTAAYDIGAQTGKAAVPGVGNAAIDAAIAGERPAAGGLDAYGIGAQTGRAKPPASELPRGRTPQEHENARAFIADQKFIYADPKLKGVVNAMIQAMPKADAQVMGDILNGMAPRGALTDRLAQMNRFVKPMMVYGAIIPKLGSDVRNALSSVWQTMSNPEARQHTVGMAKQFVPNVLKSLDDGLEHMFGARIGPNEFMEYEHAMHAEGGQASKALGSITNPTLAEAARQGVLGNNFVTAERLVNETARVGARKWMGKVWDLPGVLFKGTEQRARYVLFKALRGKGVEESEAGRIVRDSLYDYSVSSKENRLARDLIPFFQYPAKAIPQQARFLLEKPAVAVGIGGLMGQGRDQETYPYLDGKASVPLGTDAQGNQQVVSGFGLPFESLGLVPNPSDNLGAFARDIKRNAIGSSQPLLKSAFAAVSGEDPYFESPYGSYDKIPGVGNAGAAGRAYNMLAGTGLIQPLSSPLATIGKALDPNRSAAVKALDMLTGANVVSIDPDRALQQRLTDYLKTHPDVRQYTGFYQSGSDSDTKQLLDALKDAKARIKARRMVEATAP